MEYVGSDQMMQSAAVRRPSTRNSSLPSGQMIGRPSRLAMTNRRLRVVGAPKSAAISCRASIAYPRFSSCFHQRRNVNPRRSGHGSPVSSSGPQSSNSSTFSSMMTRGRTAFPQRTTTHARPRIFLSTGFPPFALLKCLQSGENQASPTGRPRQASAGSTFQMSSQ
jgi:hypothetical protein